jgi:predicted DNA-binding transcriptional regulator YafY
MTDASLVRMLKLLTVVEGRDTRQLCTLLGASRATVKRDIRILRRCGVVVSWDKSTHRFSVKDAGPFNLQALKRSSFHLHRITLVTRDGGRVVTS